MPGAPALGMPGAPALNNGGKEVGKSLVDVCDDGLLAVGGSWLGCVLGIGC
jgi:hypothetical protein